MINPTSTILRLPAVLNRTGLSRSTVYAAIAAGSFPKPVKLSARAVGFLTSEVDAWISERVSARASS